MVPKTPIRGENSQHDSSMLSAPNPTIQDESSNVDVPNTNLHTQLIVNSQTNIMNPELSCIPYSPAPSPTQGGDNMSSKSPVITTSPPMQYLSDTSNSLSP